MHLLKRMAGGLMALVLTISLLPAASARQFYSYMLSADNAAEIEEMLDAVSDQVFSATDASTVQSYIEHFLYKSDFSAIYGGRYPYTNAQGYWSGKSVSDGTYSQVVSATGCFAYCKFVSQVIYGTQGVRRDLNERAGRITADGLKAFLEEYAQAGEHIRVDSKHSVTFVSGNGNGFYYLDYAGDQNPRIWLRYTTYGNFAARCNELGKKVWIYEANPALNSSAPAEPESYEPADWLADYVQAAEQLGLTNSGSTLSCDSELTLAEAVTFIARAHSLVTVGGIDFDADAVQNWYDPYVDYLLENQILSEQPDYSAVVSREQFVDLLYAAVPADVSLEPVQDPVLFADADAIADPEAVDALVQAGVVTGAVQEDGVFFFPDHSITRGEAIVVLTRLLLSEFRA